MERPSLRRSPDAGVRLGIFGGSFDPPHIGHLLTAGDAAERLRFDRVVFIPAAVQPLKAGRAYASAEHRLEMTRLMVAGFGLGAGLASLNKAIAYSRQRRQMGTLLCEKQGFTHKLLVPSGVSGRVQWTATAGSYPITINVSSNSYGESFSDGPETTFFTPSVTTLSQAAPPERLLGLSCPDDGPGA